MRTPHDEEVISIVQAIDEEVRKQIIGVRGMSFLAREAARIIRLLRQDLDYTDRHG